MENIPDSYRLLTLNEVCQVESRQIQPDAFSKYVYYVGLEHIEKNTGKVLYQNIKDANLKSSKFEFDQECILFGKLRPYLKKVAMPTVKGICSTDILPIRPNKKIINRDYLYFFLKTPHVTSIVTDKSAGANLPRISPKILLQIEIPVPDLRTQEVIAKVLNKSRALIEKREQSNQIANKLIQAVFVHMFGDPAINPMKWEITTISNVLKTTQYGLNAKPTSDRKGIPIIRMNNLTVDGNLLLEDLKFVEATTANIEKYLLRKGDLLFNRTNSRELVGKTAIFNDESQYTFASYLIRVVTDNRRIIPEYLSGFLNSSYGKMLLLKKAKGAIGQANINATELGNISVPLPPVELQEQYARICSQIKAVQRMQQLSTTEVQQLFDSLISRAFTGELVK